MIGLMALLYILFRLALVNLATRRRGAAANSTAQSGEPAPRQEDLKMRRLRSVGRGTGERRGGVTWHTGLPNGRDRDKEERARQVERPPVEEQGGRMPGPHPARVGRRM